MSRERFYLILVIVILITAGILRLMSLFNQTDKPINVLEKKQVKEKLVGGDRDSHNCLGSAGYTWCQDKGKCLRPWEEPCTLTIDTPKKGEEISSPLLIKGEAEKDWFSKGEIVVTLVDENNNRIASASLTGKNGTSKFISFSGTLRFQTDSQQGYLIFQKGNEKDNLFKVSLQFK